jgi:hypothetical protein
MKKFGNYQRHSQTLDIKTPQETSRQNEVFFRKNSFERKRILTKGKYFGKLIDVKTGKNKPYSDEEPKDTLVFSFELQDGITVQRTVLASNSLKSKCMELVNQLSSDRPISTEVMRSPDLLQAHILGLIGRKYNLNIEPSQDEKYNNVVFVAPISTRGAYA